MFGKYRSLPRRVLHARIERQEVLSFVGFYNGFMPANLLSWRLQICCFLGLVLLRDHTLHAQPCGNRQRAALCTLFPLFVKFMLAGHVYACLCMFLQGMSSPVLCDGCFLSQAGHLTPVPVGSGLIAVLIGG